jgi:hypothetical protein
LEKLRDITLETVPRPKKPQVTMFKDEDKDLIRNLHEVFVRHGWNEGRIVRVEFDCGTPAPLDPKDFQSCFRVCVPGQDNKSYCTWVCFDNQRKEADNIDKN